MACFGRFFFALFSLFRNSLSLGLLERPLVIGLFWGLFTGDYIHSLYVAIFFELFWLDILPVGAFVSPHITAGTFMTLAVSTRLGLEVPSAVALVILFSLPLTWLGAKMESFLRDRQQVAYTQLLGWARNPKDDALPGKLILRSMASSLAFYWGSFFLLLMVYCYVLQQVISFYPNILSFMNVKWLHLWTAATVGGVLSLRIRRAYAVLGTGAALVLLFAFFAPLWPWQS